MMKVLFVVALTLFAIVHYSTALTCYSCTNCPDPFNPAQPGVRNITAGAGQSCKKQKGKILGFEGVSRTAEACGTNKCEKVSLFGQSSTVCCCNTDMCNGARQTTITTLMVVVIALVIAIMNM
ncbi:unnamed protein product [Didymodactylos carnosus]|uniref:Protein sleepless n=1 Tax=Didymodactylos carnosus TaxID=1234261 RepID=A0A814RBW6_9BILA|nr:unnamed protein product [Didymodactylos carnosus]CAF3895621.1 unnamed protein product [Didymodactylos carnosus]